ncbi:MAG TPA: hypothetical protein VER55_07500 [Ardenticatenaceae bacterium]|nr:hypothetical protein [Ardenticatenaceae bacterium]
MYLTELTDVVALHEKDPVQGPSQKASVPHVIAARASPADVQAFENAGWVFRERSSEELPEGVPQAKVFVKSGGRLALATNRLTVKLRGEPSEDEANAILEPFGCYVAEQFKFAPGAFQVVCRDQARGDVVDVANQLMDSGLVEEASPDLLEAMGGRSY